MENKKNFIKKFGELLNLTRLGIKKCTYEQNKDGNEYMYIHLNSKSIKKINISGDSEYAIIQDFCRQLSNAPFIK